MSKANDFVTHLGSTVTLGQLIGKGGEGEVYLLQGDADSVAKIYTRSPRPDTADKLRTLVTMGRPELWRVAAVPRATLHKGSPTNPVVGLLMPLVPLARFQPIHFLYSPAHRKTAFPDANWRFLIHTARNCASAFDKLHGAGVVIGDVNHSNLMVASDTDVRLIDCDSFQVTYGSRVFRCEVGVPEFTPPELQGVAFSSVERTPHHDNFGLAILVFHLLFMGRHPFSGVYQGRGDMPLDKAIRESRFAYGPDAIRFAMAAPPLTLTLTTAGNAISQLFHKAFSGKVRPAAWEWREALDALKVNLKECATDSGHVFLATLPACPWCELMTRGAPNYFITVALSAGTRTVDSGEAAEELWRKIAALAFPHRHYQRESVPVCYPTALPPGVPRVKPSLFEPALDVPQLCALGVGIACCVVMLSTLVTLPTVAVLAAVATACAAIVFAILDSPRRAVRNRLVHLYKEERDSRSQKARKAKRRVDDIEERLRTQISDLARRFDRLRADLSECHSQYASTAGRLAEEKKQLEAHARSAQLEEFLDRHLIEVAQIDDIGPGRKATLRSFGIETAADISKQRISGIKGFKEKRTSKLLAWRRSVESKFRFDAARGVPKAKLLDLESRYTSTRRGLLARLRGGFSELDRLVTHSATTIGGIKSSIPTLLREAAQAEQDAKVFR